MDVSDLCKGYLGNSKLLLAAGASPGIFRVRMPFGRAENYAIAGPLPERVTPEMKGALDSSVRYLSPRVTFHCVPMF